MGNIDGQWCVLDFGEHCNCKACGTPMAEGDSAYFTGFFQNVYCSRKCAEEDVGALAVPWGR
jgi:hypothetical protein